METVKLTPEQILMLYAVTLYPNGVAALLATSGLSEEATKEHLRDLRKELMPILPEERES